MLYTAQFSFTNVDDAIELARCLQYSKVKIEIDYGTDLYDIIKAKLADASLPEDYDWGFISGYSAEQIEQAKNYAKCTIEDIEWEFRNPVDNHNRMDDDKLDNYLHKYLHLNTRILRLIELHGTA